jgi:hypothetical protein
MHRRKKSKIKNVHVPNDSSPRIEVAEKSGMSCERELLDKKNCLIMNKNKVNEVLDFSLAITITLLSKD